VTVVEARERILPNWDEPLTNPVRRWLERAGVTLHLGAPVERVERREGGALARVRTRNRATVPIAADQVLVTVGRRPLTDGWGLEAMAIDMAGPFVRIDDRCRTSMRDVWAIGDLVGEPMLAHKASAQGEMVAELIGGGRRRLDPVVIPAVCFTDPEIVGVGLGPEDTGAAGIDLIVSQFPFAANGRALSMEAGEDGGFVRVVARADDHRVLGVQAVGPHVSESVGEFTLAIEMGALLEDVAGTIHAHPTLTEAFHEASLRGLGHAIHI
jgi:dihydrolipoamide dehydrogenase